jgi:phosphoglycolate phosphatase-like HAD superfamily hydrolase
VLSSSLRSCWAFDVDGVLAATRSAVKLAYQAAGVEQPDDVWGLSWKLWLPSIVGDAAPEVHGLKQQYYEAMLQEGAAEPLPGAAMARALYDAGNHVHYVTSASQRSAQAVLRSLKLDPSHLRAWEVTSVERTKVLADLRQAYLVSQYLNIAHFTYVDDREEGTEVARNAGWLFAHAQWTP